RTSSSAAFVRSLCCVRVPLTRSLVALMSVLPLHAQDTSVVSGAITLTAGGTCADRRSAGHAGPYGLTRPVAQLAGYRSVRSALPVQSAEFQPLTGHAELRPLTGLPGSAQATQAARRRWTWLYVEPAHGRVSGLAFGLAPAYLDL